jgi:hypothetical protein
MPTVIDELVTEISLDPAKFTAGRQRLQDELGKTSQAVETFGKRVASQTDKIADSFSVMKRGAAGILAAFVGGEAASFIERVATMDAHTMQLAHSINTSTRELSLWQNMVRGVGGTAADANSLFAGLNDTFMGMIMGNQMPSAPFAALMSRAGINRGGTPGQALQQIMGFLQNQPEQAQRFWLQQVPGMTERSMFLLMEIMRHPEKMANFAEELKKIGLASDTSGAAALDLAEKTGELEAAWESLARVLFPILTTITTAAAQLLSLPGIGKVLEGAAAGAVVGSVIPGVGTIGGALAGAAGGAIYGMATGGGGASRGDRNNNPGNIKFGPWAQAHGATSQDSGGFAIFPSSQTGAAAMAQLLHDQYQGLTLSQIQQRWVGNADAGYLSSMMAATGLKAGDVPNLNDNRVVAGLIKGMMRGEGTHMGARGATTKTSSVNIGSINVTSNKADPKAVADQIPASMERYSMLSGINSGLV